MGKGTTESRILGRRVDGKGRIEGRMYKKIQLKNKILFLIHGNHPSRRLY